MTIYVLLSLLWRLWNKLPTLAKLAFQKKKSSGSALTDNQKNKHLHWMGLCLFFHSIVFHSGCPAAMGAWFLQLLWRQSCHPSLSYTLPHKSQLYTAYPHICLLGNKGHLLIARWKSHSLWNQTSTPYHSLNEECLKAGVKLYNVHWVRSEEPPATEGWIWVLIGETPDWAGNGIEFVPPVLLQGPTVCSDSDQLLFCNFFGPPAVSTNSVDSKALRR